MPRRPLPLRCQHCGTGAPRWLGRCPACGAWNALVEAASATARSLNEVDGEGLVPLPTGQPELDAVLGGGLWPGSVALVVGEPGVGKSTLLLQALSSMAAAGTTALWASAEESSAQVRRRAERLGPVSDRLLVLDSGSLADIEEAVAATGPGVVVVDSLQTVVADGAGSRGGAAQARTVLERLVRLAAERSASTVVVGHVRKDGRMAGPRAVEHLADTVLWLEGDRHTPSRVLRAVKHRHAPTTTTGLLALGSSGLATARPVAPGAPGRPGRLTVPVWAGGRSVMIDVEALLGPPGQSRPGVRCHGLVSSRVIQLVATLEQVLGCALADRQVLVAALGEVPAKEPAADLAVALALWSAASGAALPPGAVAVGEVGLHGELRPVAALGRRLCDAARLGSRLAVVPATAAAEAAQSGLALVAAEDLAAVVSRLPAPLPVAAGRPGTKTTRGAPFGPGGAFSLPAAGTAPAGVPTVGFQGGGTIRWWWSTTGTGR